MVLVLLIRYMCNAAYHSVLKFKERLNTNMIIHTYLTFSDITLGVRGRITSFLIYFCSRPEKRWWFLAPGMILDFMNLVLSLLQFLVKMPFLLVAGSGRRQGARRAACSLDGARSVTQRRIMAP